MRAILVVNPKATTTSELSREVLVRALRSEVNLTVEYTRRRGHAAEIGRRARDQEVEVVVTLGGDGTVNEVVNGLLHRGPSDAVPALAVVPGGSTNVFARALGLPKDPVEGTGVILDALHHRRTRSVGLGRADDRYFTFCAGLGLDAEVIHAVERARLRGRASTPALYLRSMVTRFFTDTDHRTPQITLERPGNDAESGIASVIVQNTAPWTFIGNRAINPCADASFDTGLDLMAMRALHVPATARAMTYMVSRRPRRPHRQMLTLHDLSEFTLCAARPMAFQLDGDYLGERTKIALTSVVNAMRVFC